jgi:hypothetical protein
MLKTKEDAYNEASNSAPFEKTSRHADTASTYYLIGPGAKWVGGKLATLQ